VTPAALLWVPFAAPFLYLGFRSRPWRDVADVPRQQWLADLFTAILLVGLGILTLSFGFQAPLWLVRAVSYAWLVSLTVTGSAWVWQRWREPRADQVVANPEPRPFGATTAMVGWLFGMPIAAGALLTGALTFWNQVVAVPGARIPSADLPETLAPLLLVTAFLTAPGVWLVQAVRRRRWEERQRVHVNRLAGLDVPALSSRWQAVLRVLGL
jgi:hypothetical protein